MDTITVDIDGTTAHAHAYGRTSNPVTWERYKKSYRVYVIIDGNPHWGGVSARTERKARIKATVYALWDLSTQFRGDSDKWSKINAEMAALSA